MAQQKINPESGVYDHNTDPSTNYDNNHVVRVGTQNAGNGDPLRTAMLKINEAFDKTDSNFDEVYSALAAAGGDLSAIASDIIPADDNTYNIGSPNNRWKHGYFASGSLYVGDIKLSNDNGRLLVQQVTDAGLITEAPVPNTPGTVTTDRLINGAHSFLINADGTLSLNGSPFTGSTDLGLLKISGSTIGTKDDPDTGNWGSYGLYLDPGGESSSYIQIPSVAGQTTGATLIIANNNTGNGGIRLSVQGGELIFTDTGIDLPYNLPVRQNNSWTKVTTPLVNIGAGTVVWTSEVNYISSAKLIIQVECSEVGDASGWHSQACEAIIACRGFAGTGPTGDPQMIVYGVVHTSVDPLVTFTVQRNPTTKMVEVVGTLTAAAAGAADLRIHSVEMSTRD